MVLLVPPHQELPCIGCQEVSLGPAAFVAHAAKCLAVALIAKMQQQQQRQHQQLVPDQQPLPDDGVEIVAPPPVPDDEVSDWLSLVLVVPSSPTVSQDPVLTYLGTFMKECPKSCGKWLKSAEKVRTLQHRTCFKSSSSRKSTF